MNQFQSMESGLACGTSRIVGCRFSIYPMSSQFVSIILDAIESTDTSKVWMQSDDVSTCVRGRYEHVFNVVQAMFTRAANSGEHVVFSGTFSVGCPGDSAGDVYLSEDDLRMNECADGTITACQFSLYPLGVPGYMDMIYDAVHMAEANGTFSGGIHYASRLDGITSEVFRTLEQAFSETAEKASHVVMTATVSCNSPSAKPEHIMSKEAAR